jgi:tyrosinase
MGERARRTAIMAVLTAVAPRRSRSSFIAEKKFSGVVTVRRSVYDLTAEEVTAYRRAVRRIARISEQNVHDHRGYQYIAGMHGLPDNKCQHHNPAFALWHRPYVQGFEQRLQDALPGADDAPAVFLPYWDWTTPKAQAEGIPQIFLDKTWVNPDTNKREANPLLSQPILFGRGHDPTSRDPNKPRELVRFAHKVQTALRADDYLAFTADIEDPHGGVHLWVGGDMSDQDTAAFDPLFWSHHCFIEYLFCQWQDAHPEEPHPHIDTRRLSPFGLTVDDIWEYRSLGYVYEPDSESNTTPATLNLRGHGRDSADAKTADGLVSGATITTFSLQHVIPDFDRAEVRFEGLTPPKDSLEVRIFANEPRANAKTPTDENEHFLGSHAFFGHGDCVGAPGHCDVIDRDIFDLRGKHHYAPVQVRVNVTRRLRRLIEREQVDSIPITLVVVDRRGKELVDSGLHFEGFMIVIR